MPLRRSIRQPREAILGTLIATVLAMSGVAVTAPPASADGPGSGTPWVVTVGDSYISGEAGRWAANKKRRTT